MQQSNRSQGIITLYDHYNESMLNVNFNTTVTNFKNK